MSNVSNLRFPRIVRAAKAYDISQWDLADALLKDATEKNLDAVAAELKEHGIEVTTRYLDLLRQTAETFPPDRRHEKVAFRAHIAAGNPDSLDVIVKAARKDGTTVSLDFVENVLRGVRAEAKAKAAAKRRKLAQEEFEAEEEEKRAQNPTQRKLAKDKKRKAKAKRMAVRSPRRKDLPAPDEKDVNPLAAKAEFMTNANEARRLARHALELISPNLDEYSPAAIAGLTDACLTVANVWREIAAELAKRAKKDGKGLMQVVNS